MYGWSIFILWRNCKHESESENIVTCLFRDILNAQKASSIAVASAENIVASSGSLAKTCL